MRKFFPLLLVCVGLFAIIGVAFVLIRTDAMPARVRGFDWRKARATPEVTPTEEPAA